jgi:hypothetical protein
MKQVPSQLLDTKSKQGKSLICVCARVKCIRDRAADGILTKSENKGRKLSLKVICTHRTVTMIQTKIYLINK